MSAEITTTSESTPATVVNTATQPYEVKHLMLGVEMDYADVNLLQYATSLSGLLNIRHFHCVHATPDLALLRAFIDIGPGLYEMYNLNEAIKKELGERVAKYTKGLQAERSSYDVLEGKPLTTLLAAAEENAADLLVIG